MLQKIIFERHIQYWSFHGRKIVAPIKYLNMVICIVQMTKSSINSIGIKVTKENVKENNSWKESETLYLPKT